MLKTISKFISCFLIGACHAALAQPPDLSHLMVVLRETIGADKRDESLKSIGKVSAQLPDGRQIELEPAWYEYLGDMQIRFIYDSDTSMRNLMLDEFKQLNLSPEQALDIAIKNIKQTYGEPQASPWNSLMLVEGKSPDLDSSYFLDKEFWLAQSKKYPEGLVAIVPKRGGLLFAPLTDKKALQSMHANVGMLYETSKEMRISSAIYLFKNGTWSVLQAPLSAQTNHNK